VESAGYDVGGRRYKRLPRGYEVPLGREELMLHDGLFAGIDRPVPEEIETPAFPAFCARRYRELAPLQDWLLTLSK
jgi:hypothetical protein